MTAGKGGILLIIPAEGPIHEEEYTEDEPDEKRIIQLVGGWLEQVPGMIRYGHQLCVAYADEEGLLKQLPFNETATRLVRADHRIVGTMVVVVPRPPTSAVRQNKSEK